MGDIITRILDSPATNYVLSFGTLGATIMLALNWIHKRLGFSDRVWALLTLAAGATGGVLLQECGFVSVPADSGLGGLILAGFIGAVVAAAAAGFSSVDLRHSVMRKPKD